MIRVTSQLPGMVALLCALAFATTGMVGNAQEQERQTIAMIGSGAMGSTLGKLWAAAGYHVIFSSRHPDELDDVVAAAGHGAEAAPVGEAIGRADIITMAVPYKAEPSIAQAHGDRMKGKVMVNVDNAQVHRDGAIANEAEAVGEAIYSARLFEGTRFIRAFNLKGAYSFPDPDEVESARFDMPWTTNDPSVRPIAEALIRATGGTPVYEGGLERPRVLTGVAGFHVDPDHERGYPAMKPFPARNVHGEALETCGTEPMTGFYRDGCCNTGNDDHGIHTVCAQVTEEFLAFSRRRGNDLAAPNPAMGFRGLQPGDCWCLCASRWVEAHKAGCAPGVYLGATHEETLAVIPYDILVQYALDRPATH